MTKFFVIAAFFGDGSFEVMKFLHAADLHLDTPFQGLDALPEMWQHRLTAAPFTALQRLVDLAITEQVDFVLLVGDLFDQQAQSVPAQAALMAALDQLAAEQIPVILSFGNHDFQPDVTTWHFPANVHVFDAQVTTVELTTKQQQRVAITGFSYDQRWVTTPKVQDFPLKRTGVDYQIGMLHGQVGTSGDHYAPFAVSDLLAKHYDYWALGHIHQRQTLNAMPPVMYPGNLQGRYRDELGAKGALLVTSQGDQLVPEFKPLAPLVWTNWTPELSGQLDRPTLLTQLSAQLQARPVTVPELVVITLPATLTLTPTAELALTQGALLAQLQQQAPATSWPVTLQLAATDTTSDLFGMDTAIWQQAGETTVTTEKIAALADHLLDEPFLNQTLLEATTPEQWQQQVLRLLQDHYHLTLQGGDSDAN
ncbi:phosphoesterase [Lactobacillus sp.] [Lactiplantibacillus mudanjiangensis]|uniref:Phosphoesterase [Lactobacillus sp.] n=2 Tax=Lactiplantibacillus mudanjiangensis TaxID=1296538 RepID=A0A660E9F4_9LACO|nr:phosphoesterase [Lactobacillus sp.] [Lactiplantibacillus mudanjiangensis]VDG29699.1 phosphoesterase [Lactobacillus sp.] [Lactiplantibacillus mudanjiangensis]VDG33630.1 phosphoesterase [Lactobacillus sp.] [Lactiplantibacillus mudanjiangensis]